MTYWHRRRKFCGVCGAPTKVGRPTTSVCASNPQGSAFSAHRSGGDHAGASWRSLHAGRGKHFPRACIRHWPASSSPASSDAVARIYEEVKVKVSAVTYHSSQPGPSPLGDDRLSRRGPEHGFRGQQGGARHRALVPSRRLRGENLQGRHFLHAAPHSIAPPDRELVGHEAGPSPTADGDHPWPSSRPSAWRQCRIAQPHRRVADVPVLRRRRFGDRLASGALRGHGQQRRRPDVRGGHACLGAGPHHPGLPRPVQRRQRGGAEARRRLVPRLDAQYQARHPDRPCRSQGLGAASVEGRRPAHRRRCPGHAVDHDLGVGDPLRRHRAGSRLPGRRAGAAADGEMAHAGGTGSRRHGPREGGVRAPPSVPRGWASTCSSCTARTAISCTSSSRRSPITSATTHTAARWRSGGALLEVFEAARARPRERAPGRAAVGDRLGRWRPPSRTRSRRPAS